MEEYKKFCQFAPIDENNQTQEQDEIITPDIEIVIEQLSDNKSKSDKKIIEDINKEEREKIKAEKYFGNFYDALRNQKGYLKNQITKPMAQYTTQCSEIHEKQLSISPGGVSVFDSPLNLEIQFEIFDFGLKLINSSKINEGYLLPIDFMNLCKQKSPDFYKRILSKKLEYLFIEYQAKNTDELKDHNKKVIQDIRNNPIKELFANEYLDLSFYELANLFYKEYFEVYAQKKKEELMTEFSKEMDKIKNFCEELGNYLYE